MQNRSKVINRLALLLLSIVILELVLIGDQVAPVKAIKKKIALKKLKKLLPLLALIKPKKKIFLLPIPIPMFKKDHGYYTRPQYVQQQQHQQMVGQNRVPQLSRPQPTVGAVSLEGSSGGGGGGGGGAQSSGSQPMSFVMTNTGDGMSQFDQHSMGALSWAQMQQDLAAMMSGAAMLPMLASTSPKQAATPAGPAASVAPMGGSGGGASDERAPMAMLMPSMTMTIQSEPNGGSAIELSTNMMAGPAGGSNSSLQLRAPPVVATPKWRQQPHSNSNELFDEPAGEQPPGGEHYYSSPWPVKAPLSSPAKVYRQRAPPSQPQQSGRLQQQPARPAQAGPALIVARNQWRPNIRPNQQLANQQQQQQQHQASQQQQQQILQGPEIEGDTLVAAGPPRILPVYLTANGQLHMSPPPPEPAPPSASTNNNNNNNSEGGPSSNQASGDTSGEVGLLTDAGGPNQGIDRQPPTSPKSGRLTSPAVKGKQSAAPNNKQQAAAAGY